MTDDVTITNPPPGAPLLTLFEKWPTAGIWRSCNENIVGVIEVVSEFRREE
jgi:hypothetical protein